MWTTGDKKSSPKRSPAPQRECIAVALHRGPLEGVVLDVVGGRFDEVAGSPATKCRGTPSSRDEERPDCCIRQSTMRPRSRGGSSCVGSDLYRLLSACAVRRSHLTTAWGPPAAPAADAKQRRPGARNCRNITTTIDALLLLPNAAARHHRACKAQRLRPGLVIPGGPVQSRDWTSRPTVGTSSNTRFARST